MNRFCDRFSLKKTQFVCQGTTIPPAISVKDHQLEVVNQFTYLGSSLEVELNKRIGKAANVLSKLNKKVWGNRQLTAITKVAVYKACVTSTQIMYGSQSWTAYAAHERTLNVLHLQCLRRVLGVSWQDKVTNNEVFDRVGIPSVYTLLRQRRLRWLGHVHRMEDGRIPKYLLYGKLTTGYSDKGRPQLRYKDVCKRDMRALKWTTSTGNPWQTTYRLGNKNSCHQASKKGNSSSKKHLRRNAGKGNLRVLVVKCASDWWLGCFYLPQPQQKMLICRHDGCFLHSLTRLTVANELDILWYMLMWY